MASSPLVLPGVLFVGEDERQRLTAHTGPAAGWMTPKGILQWSSEVSVVLREALTEDVRRETKAVMPEEQIPPAKYPLTLEAAKRSPLVAVSSKLMSKLVDQNVRVHTVGVDRMTSSFFYIGEGGGEDSITVSGDLVQAVAEMLGERADNAAIERVLDSLVDRLLRSLSKDRVTELGVELAAALPRAANDGSGAQGVDLDQFEKDLAALVGSSEKYAAHLQEVAEKITGTPDRKVDVPLYVDARKVPQGPFELTVGDRKVALGTYERWVMTGPFTEPTAAQPAKTDAKPAATAAAAEPAKAEPKAETKPAPSPKPAEAKPAATTSPTPAPAKAAALAAPIAPKASDRPPAPRPATKSRPDTGEVAPAAAAQATPAQIAPQAVVSVGKADAPAVEDKKAEPAPEPAKADAKVEEKKPEPAPEPNKVEEKKIEAKVQENEAEAKADEKKKKKKADDEDEPKANAKDKDLTKDKPKDLAPEKKGGFPWLAVLIAIAVAIVVYQVWLSKK